MAASWMENLKLPLRVIKQRYTKSEMAMMAWRSSELAYNMALAAPTPSAPNTQQQRIPDNGVTDQHLQALEERLGPIAFKLENEKGELDLRKLTGDEAMQYMAALGIHIMPGVSRE